MEADTNQAFVNLYIETIVNAVTDLTKNGLIKDTRLLFLQKLVEQKDVELAVAAKKIAELETRPPTEQYAEVVAQHEGLMLQKQREHESIVQDLRNQLDTTNATINSKMNALNDIIVKKDLTINDLNQRILYLEDQIPVAVDPPKTKRKSKLIAISADTF